MITEAGEKPGFLKQTYRDAICILTEPSVFFENRFEKISKSQAIVFGLIVSWLAAFVEWIVRLLKHESLLSGLERLKHQMQSLPIWKDLPEDIWNQGSAVQSVVPEWAIEGLRMLLNPFHNFFMFYTYGFIFWMGALLLVNKENPFRKNVNYPNLVRITAVCSASTMVGAILGFLPANLGSFLGWIYHTVLLMTAFSIQFNISRLRGLTVIFLPSIISFILVVMSIAMLVAVIVAIVSSLFH